LVGSSRAEDAREVGRCGGMEGKGKSWRWW
jgi:hypothetical protein